MWSRTSYIRLSISLAMLSLALTACSNGGGGSPTMPKQNTLNRPLNSTGPVGNHGAPTPIIPGGQRIVIQQPNQKPKVSKSLLNKLDKTQTSSDSDTIVGAMTDTSQADPAPAIAAAPKLQHLNTSAVDPQLPVIQSQARVKPYKPVPHVLPHFDNKSASVQHVAEQSHAVTPRFDNSQTMSRGSAGIRVTLDNGSEVLRQIPAAKMPKISLPKVTLKKSANTGCTNPVKKAMLPARKTVRKIVRKTIARRQNAWLARERAHEARLAKGEANPLLVKRFDSLPVTVLSAEDLKTNDVAALYGSYLYDGSLDVNKAHGAINTENSTYGIQLSEYGGYVPQSLYYKFSPSPDNKYQGNSACDVQVNIGGYDYHNKPCIVFQKDSITGRLRETAYKIYVQRNPDGSVYRIVRKNDSVLKYDKKYIRAFLAGRHDGLYVVSFEQTLPGQE